MIHNITQQECRKYLQKQDEEALDRTNKKTNFIIVRVAEAQHLLQNHMPIENTLMLKVMLHHAQSTVNQKRL